MPSIDINGMRTAYNDVGTGFPVIFIPSLVGTKEWFTYQISGLKENYRVISYDLRPYKRFTQYTLDRLTDDLVKLLSALKIDSVMIAGHAFGGMVAQNMALKHRELIAGMILISGFPNLPDLPQDKLIELLAPGEIKLESKLQAIIRKLFRRESTALPAEIDGKDWLVANSARLTRATLDARLSIIRHFDSRGWLSEIEVPTLAIVGAQDRPELLSAAQTLYEGIPQCQLEVVENCDHYCFFTRFDIVDDLIDNFIKENLSKL